MGAVYDLYNPARPSELVGRACRLSSLGCARVRGKCNTVVVKPSEESARAPVLTLQIIANMLPPGVVDIVTGDAKQIGDTLTGHPLVRMVNFSGSVRVGRPVMKVAAEKHTPVTLEFGGNDAALTLEEIHLDDEVFQKMYLAAFASCRTTPGPTTNGSAASPVRRRGRCRRSSRRWNWPSAVRASGSTR